MKLGSPNIAREMTLLDRGHDFTLYDLRQVDQDLTSKEHAIISAIRIFFLMSENQFNWWESPEVKIHTWLEVSGGMNFNSKATKTSYPLYIDITSTSMSLSWDCALIHLVMLRLKKKKMVRTKNKNFWPVVPFLIWDSRSLNWFNPEQVCSIMQSMQDFLWNSNPEIITHINLCHRNPLEVSQIIIRC